MFPFSLEQEQVLLQKYISQGKIRNTESPEILTPRKDPIPNQDSTRIIAQQDPIIPPYLSKGPTGHKPFIYYTHFQILRVKNDYSADNSCTDNEDSIEK